MQEDPTISSDYIAMSSDIKELFFLFEKAPFAMSVLKGPSLAVELINEKLLEIWGKKKEEVMGKPLFKCFPELIGTDTEKIFKTAYENGEKIVTKEYETSFLRNGELYHAFFDLNIDPIQINGSVTGLLVTSTEVTDHVLARKKIEASETNYRQMIDGLAAADYTCDKEVNITL
jgi:PAS domain S-box-containing protein